MLIYHPVGTCRMSDTHEGAVVDSQLRVHGVQDLRVLFKQLFGWPARVPAAEAVAALDDAWAAAAVVGALAAFERYDFTAGEELRGTPVTIAWGRYDRLLIYSRQVPRARERLPLARHVTLGAGHVPFFDDPGAVAETVRLTALGSSPCGR
jgi:pimeloyl-ACP methyl ester carboxylesterase